MKFCDEHWTALRAAIEKRGLGHLAVHDGETVAAQLVDQVRRGGEVTPVNYDPLMSAHWAIASHALELLGRANPGAVGYLMSDGPEDPVEGYGKAYEGRTWPRCPLCYLNLAHEVSCSDSRCQLDRERGYDYWILQATEAEAQRVAEMGGEG